MLGYKAINRVLIFSKILQFRQGEFEYMINRML